MWTTIWQRIWEWPALGTIGAFAALGLILGNFAGFARKQSTINGLLRGVEAMLASAAGALLARAFISLILGLGSDSAVCRATVGWAFFLWPGAIDTIPALNGSPLFSAETYLFIATVVGALAGLMDGLYRVHDWPRLGLFGFCADMTWGLAGTTNGCIFHLVNLFVTKHAFEVTDERRGAHRYLGGFRFKKFFAVTQGAVMSNMLMTDSHGQKFDYSPGTPLFIHERTHVMQNRIFGPFFMLTYLAWLIIWLPAGCIAGAVSNRFSALECIQWSSYFNNPWEVWAYKHGGRRALGREPADTLLPMSDFVVKLFSAAFGAVVLLCAWLAVRAGWLS